MQSAILPLDEPERQKSLDSLDILDTQTEERFDRFTRLAKNHYDVAMALVTLIDHERQWFKSHPGLNVSELPRDTSFCGHTIMDERLFVVSNASRDEKFFDNPFVTGDPFINFYAGAPLHSPEGYRIGTFCIVDDKPRNFSQHDRRFLADLAGCVEHEINTSKAATQQIDEKARYLETVLNTATDAIIAVDKEGKIKTVNQATEKMFGYPKHELIDLNVMHLLPKELHALHKTMLSKYKRPQFNEQKTQVFEIEGRKKDGSVFPISLSFTPVDDYKEIRFVAVIHDDTKMKSQQNFLDAVIENIPNMVFVKEAESLRFTLFNKAGEELLGIPREQMIGKNDYDFFPKEQADFFVQKDKEVLNCSDAVDIAKEPLETANKGQRMLHTRKIGIRDKNGKPQYLLGISEDITDRIAMQERILKQAREDNLTGLANRTALFGFLSQEIKRTKRTHSKLAILYLDLNEFKPINDSFGHSFGDRVLQQIARRLSNIARESDCVARIGGDEFIIVLSNIIDAQKIDLFEARVKRIINHPITIEQNEFKISASLGVAIYPDNGLDIPTLIQFADQAMYKNKNKPGC